MLNNLGVLRKAEGRYAEARRLLPRRRSRLLGRDRQARATLEHNLGGIAHARGRYAEAEPHARRAVTLRAAALGSLAPRLGGRRRGAGGGRGGARAPRRGGGALPARPRRSSAASSASASLEFGLRLAGLAAVEQQRGKVARARSLYARALPILGRLLGRHHPDVALTVNNLAVLERDEQRLARAEALFRRAADSFGRALGPRHPHTVLARDNLRAVAAARLKPTRATRR